ncbi:MAG: hypothetical protein K1X44_08375 [Alphaproteobacteria bacterium]|nr:hypothetical protein [Alphaproteobacteria bacterium]
MASPIKLLLKVFFYSSIFYSSYAFSETLCGPKLNQINCINTIKNHLDEAMMLANQSNSITLPTKDYIETKTPVMGTVLTIRTYKDGSIVRYLNDKKQGFLIEGNTKIKTMSAQSLLAHAETAITINKGRKINKDGTTSYIIEIGKKLITIIYNTRIGEITVSASGISQTELDAILNMLNKPSDKKTFFYNHDSINSPFDRSSQDKNDGKKLDKFKNDPYKTPISVVHF